ncbi:P pilus assembly protein, pilin FimA [Enterobacteriaceae bacterium strain FGI 57]|nr:P pilus assembly protein, pilin FimA [Enterobacteriaceae bacterium strain FGI 57]
MNIINKTLLASSLALLASSAMATDGTIEFTGEILTTTCEFANGDVINVELGHYAASQFKSIGDRTPAIPVPITLKNCPLDDWDHVDGNKDNSFQVWLETRSGGTTGANNDLVAVTSMEVPAEGVGIRIDSVKHNTQMALNKLNDPKISFTPEADGTATVALQAYYVSTVDATAIKPGEANASVDVTIDYR